MAFYLNFFSMVAHAPKKKRESDHISRVLFSIVRDIVVVFIAERESKQVEIYTGIYETALSKQLRQ